MSFEEWFNNELNICLTGDSDDVKIRRHFHGAKVSLENVWNHQYFKIKSLRLEVKQLEGDRLLLIDGVKTLEAYCFEKKAENKKLRECVGVYADSENPYHVARTIIDNNSRKHFIMKNIVQVSKLAQECLKELKVKK